MSNWRLLDDIKNGYERIDKFKRAPKKLAPIQEFAEKCNMTIEEAKDYRRKLEDTKDATADNIFFHTFVLPATQRELKGMEDFRFDRYNINNGERSFPCVVTSKTIVLATDFYDDRLELYKEFLRSLKNRKIDTNNFYGIFIHGEIWDIIKNNEAIATWDFRKEDKDDSYDNFVDILSTLI